MGIEYRIKASTQWDGLSGKEHAMLDVYLSLHWGGTFGAFPAGSTGLTDCNNLERKQNINLPAELWIQNTYNPPR